MILLDTHALIWLAADPEKLSKKASEAIRASSLRGGLGIAAITLWEVAWLAAHGRLAFSGTIEAFAEKISSRSAILPLTPRIAALAAQFPAAYSSDPCDRLIGATALAENIPLVTKDAQIRRSGQLACIW